MLDQPDVTPMTERTVDRWPAADVLVEYLQDYAQVQVEAGRILFGAIVESITYANANTDGSTSTSTHHHDFQLELTLSPSDGDSVSSASAASIRCGAVVVATGLPTPFVPANVPGIELAEGYEHQPPTGEAADNLSVAVLGMGNAGLETYDSLSSHAAYVHVMPGRGRRKRAERVSWESRYVGDIRALNAGLLDAYLYVAFRPSGSGVPVVRHCDALSSTTTTTTSACVLSTRSVAFPLPSAPLPIFLVEALAEGALPCAPSTQVLRVVATFTVIMVSTQEEDRELRACAFKLHVRADDCFLHPRYPTSTPPPGSSHCENIDSSRSKCRTSTCHVTFKHLA